MSRFLDYAEDTSHAFLGESRSGPFSTQHSALQRVAAHGLGYAFSPLRYGIEASVSTIAGSGNRSKSAVPSASNKNFSVSAMSAVKKGKKKKLSPAAKRFAQISAALASKLRVSPPKQARRPVYNLRRPNTARRGRGQVNLGRRGAQTLERRAPPVRYGRIAQSGAGLRFSQGRRAGCMTMKGACQVGFINAGITAVSGEDQVRIVSSDGVNSYQQMRVQPQNKAFFPTPIWIFTQLFDRYEIKTRLRYVGFSGTTATGSVKFCYFEDPVGFYDYSHKDMDLSNPVNIITSGDLVGAPTVKEGPVWTEWSTPWSWSQRKDAMCYTSSGTYTAAPSWTTQLQPAWREQVQGTWVMCGANIGDESGPLGELWCDYEIELCDLNTSAVLPDSSLTIRRSLRSLGVDDDEKVPDAPKCSACGIYTCFGASDKCYKCVFVKREKKEKSLKKSSSTK